MLSLSDLRKYRVTFWLLLGIALILSALYIAQDKTPSQTILLPELFSKETELLKCISVTNKSPPFAKLKSSFVQHNSESEINLEGSFSVKVRERVFEQKFSAQASFNGIGQLYKASAKVYADRNYLELESTGLAPIQVILRSVALPEIKLKLSGPIEIKQENFSDKRYYLKFPRELNNSSFSTIKLKSLDQIALTESSDCTGKELMPYDLTKEFDELSQQIRAFL